MLTGDDDHAQEFRTNRCMICDLNWPATKDFTGPCKKCHCDTENVVIRSHRGDRAMTSQEAYELWTAIRRYDARLEAEEGARQARDAEKLERLITSATAALNYDMDHWLEASEEDLA